MQSPQDTVPSVPSAEEHARLTDTRSRHAESLLRLSRRFESAQTYPEVLEAAREEVRSAIGYTNLWVYLISDDRKYAYALVGGGPVSGDDWMKSEMGRLTIEGDAMLEEIARATHPVVVEDARTDPRTDKKVVAALGNRTIINVPIIFSEQILGTVGTGTFGDEGVRARGIEFEHVVVAGHHATGSDLVGQRGGFLAGKIAGDPAFRPVSINGNHYHIRAGCTQFLDESVMPERVSAVVD